MINGQIHKTRIILAVDSGDNDILLFLTYHFNILNFGMCVRGYFLYKDSFRIQKITST